MQNEKVLITGCAGSGGSYLAEYLVNNHPEVEVHGIARWHSTTSLDNLKAIRNKIKVHECDLLDLPSIIRIFHDVRPSKIFGLASHANVRVCFDTPLAVLNNNIMSVANLLEAIRMECPDAIYQHCSTSEVYGNPQNFPMTEDHPLEPVNPYSVSKLAQEKLAYAYFKSWKLRVVITRMFAYINPRRRDLFATSFAFQVAEIEKRQRSVLEHGNLESIRTLIDVRDAMDAYWVACDHCEYGVPYNIGGDSVISVGEFLELLKEHAHAPIQSVCNQSLLRPVDVTRQIPDTSRFAKATNGWRPKYKLGESIDFLLDFCRSNVL